MLEPLIRLSRNLGITVVAQGIETQEQLGALNGMGCTLGQGALLSQPLDAARALALAEAGSRPMASGAEVGHEKLANSAPKRCRGSTHEAQEAGARAAKESGATVSRREARQGKELVIVTGISGSGKASALKAFEDLGFHCVDNMPLELLPDLPAGEQLCRSGIVEPFIP